MPIRVLSPFAFGFSAFVVLGQAGSDTSQLAIAAQSTARPKECGRGDDGQGPGLWDTARQPRLPRYCDLLAQATARLQSSPTASREIATIADEILPEHAAPLVLRARASVQLRDFEAAALDFLEARKRDPRGVEDPLSLFDMAMAFRNTGRHAQALEAYRVLVPRISLLPTPQHRSSVLLQAAALSMADGEQGLPEALALLSEARHLPVSRLDRDISGMLALASERAGRSDQARASLDQVLRPGTSSLFAGRSAESFEFLADSADQYAMEALVLERSDTKRAIELWDRYLSSTKLEFYKAHARKRIELLKKGPVRMLRPQPAPAPAGKAPKPTITRK